MADLPRLTILRGDDLARVQALLTEFKAGIGDALTAEMNTTLLDADTLNLDALRADCLTMPFLAERRLVIVDKARPILTKLNAAERTKLLDILENLPDSAALVLVVEDAQTYRRGERFWENARAYTGCLSGLAGMPKLGRLSTARCLKTRRCPPGLRGRPAKQEVNSARTPRICWQVMLATTPCAPIRRLPNC